MAVNDNVISICVQIIKHESPLCAICMLPKCMFYFLLIEDLSQRPSWLFLHISNLCFIYLSMLFIRILCNSSSNFLSMLCLLPHFVFAYFCISCSCAGERPHGCLLPHFRQNFFKKSVQCKQEQGFVSAVSEGSTNVFLHIEGKHNFCEEINLVNFPMFSLLNLNLLNLNLKLKKLFDDCQYVNKTNGDRTVRLSHL